MRILLLLLIAVSAYGQIAFKAFTEAEPSGASTTVATTSTLNIATGDTIIACVGRGEGGSSITGIIDNNGGANSLTKVGSTSTSTDNSVGAIDMWVKTNATANATALFTATINTSSDFRLMMVGQYSGLATSSVVDQTSCRGASCTAATTANNVTATNVTTTQADELLAYCAYHNSATNWNVQNAFTLRSGSLSLDHNLADKIVSATGSYPGGDISTLGATPGQVGVFATFKKASAGGSTTRKRVVVTQ